MERISDLAIPTEFKLISLLSVAYQAMHYTFPQGYRAICAMNVM